MKCPKCGSKAKVVIRLFGYTFQYICPKCKFEFEAEDED